MERPAVPVLDTRMLALVARDVGTDAATEFLGTYLRLLPGRIDRIAGTIARADLDAAMDAVLSQKVTSSMIGAIRLEQYCQGLQASFHMAFHRRRRPEPCAPPKPRWEPSS